MSHRRPSSVGRGTVGTMRGPAVYADGGYHEPDWLAVERELDAMLAIARSVDARLVLVHIPSQHFRRPDAPYAARRLAAWRERRDVEVIDTLPALRAAAEREQGYWTRDIHCTSAGYRVIAETLFTELTRRGLVPK